MNISLKDPLWKTALSDEDYIRLKELIKQNFTGFRTIDPSLLNKFTALYYASWWRREYLGGIPSREAIAESLDLKGQWRAVYDVAKMGLRQLRINPIKGPQNTLWLRTMLVQGGLPMACIASNQDQFNGFRDFLGKLIEYSSTYVVNWDNSDFIGDLPFLYKLPKSFQNEGIFELCLQIAKAINEGDDTLLPFDVKEKQWNEITQELKTIKKKERTGHVNLSIKWFIRNAIDLKLYLQVELPKLIPISYMERKGIVGNSFQLFASEKQLATYDKCNEESYVLRQNNNQFIEWKNEPAINVIVRTNTGKQYPISLSNNLPPDLDAPILAVHTSGYWTIQSNLSSSLPNTVLFDPKIWAPTTAVDDKELTTLFNIGGKALAAISAKEEIEFANILSREIARYDNKGANYSSEFAYPVVSWMRQTSITVINSAPKIYVYSEDGSKVGSSDFEIEYRLLNGIANKWERYQRNTALPIGKIEFKIIYPDKKKAISRFFNIGGLCSGILRSNDRSCKIEFIGESQFSINTIADQKGITCVNNADRSFEFNRNTAGTYHPSHIEFVIAHSTGNMHFKIIAPFRGLSIYDSEKNIQTTESICLNALYHYHILAMGEPCVCKLYHSLNPGRVFTYKIPEGAHCLTQFESSIKRLLQLNENGADSITSYIRLECQSGNQKKLLKIKEYNLSVEVDLAEKKIQISNDNGKPLDQSFDIYSIDVSITNPETNIAVKLTKESNAYGFPGFVSEGSAFLIFSESHLSDKIPPTLVSINCPQFDYSTEEFRVTIFETLEMAAANAELWKTIVRLFDIASSHSLPFNTFDQLKVIAKSPYLLVKMAYAIWSYSRQGANIIKEQLVRFENEMGIAFHWIKNEIWDNCFNDWFISQYDTPELMSAIPEFGRMLMRERMNFINFSFQFDSAFSILNAPEKYLPKTIDSTFITVIRQLVEDEKNLIDCRIEIPHELFDIFPLAFNFGNKNLVPNFNLIKTLLLSPFKSALAASGKDDSLWDQFSEDETTRIRRAILFYRAFRPDIYYHIFENTFITVNQVNA